MYLSSLGGRGEELTRMDLSVFGFEELVLSIK